MKIRPDKLLQQVQKRVFDEDDLEGGLLDIYKCISDVVPLERVLLLHFDHDRKMCRVIAHAIGVGAEETNFMFDVPDEIIELLCSQAMPETHIINQPDKDPLGAEVMKYSGMSDWSAFLVNFKNDTNTYGAAVILTDGRDKFKQDHSYRITRLKAPLQLALDTAITANEKRIQPPLWKEPVADKNEFFRQVTRRLCGHLDLKTGVDLCNQYLSRFLPADALMVMQVETGLKSERIHAEAFGMLQLHTQPVVPWAPGRPAPDAFREGFEAHIINEPEDYPEMRPYFNLFGDDWSAIIMPLVHEDRPFGVAIMALVGKNRYTETHKQLFSLLHDPFALALSNNIKHREVIRLKNIISQERKDLQKELNFPAAGTIVGARHGLRDVMDSARLVAEQDSPVLLTGETGVGKEIIANFIHQQSSRRDGPFIKVNCGAIPDTLVDSELFGHEKGAFTDARSRKKGRFERASRGTIFLDEIGELPLPAQVRLLRVLQNKVIERVGGTEAIPVDIRIIAATHRNLEELMASGKFREDLWFRLNVFPIRIPPLRSRKEDIPALADHFIEKKSFELRFQDQPTLSTNAMRRLTAYDWPGNVRELENVIERELILNKGGRLTFQHVSPEPPKDNPSEPAIKEDNILSLDEVFARHAKEALTLSGGRVEGPGGASELLGIKPGTLRSRMKKLGIPYGRNKT